MSEVKEAEASVSSSDTTVTTTTETVAATTPAVPLPTRTNRLLLLAWAQLTTGAGTTTVTPRIRRGSGITGTVVNEANAETIKAAAGSTEVFFTMALEEREDEGDVDYSLTLQQAGASGNGTILQAGIVALVL